MARYLVPHKEALIHNIFRVRDVRYLHASEQWAATSVHGDTVMFTLDGGKVKPLGLEYEPNRYAKAQTGIKAYFDAHPVEFRANA